MNDLNDSFKFILRACANEVVKDMIGKVASRTAINGSPQKKNKPSTIAAKGHDFQLRHSTDKFVETSTYRISIASNRAYIDFNYPAENGGNVGFYVTEKGYKFFGISQEAESKCLKFLAGWWSANIPKFVKKELLYGVRNFKKG